MPGLLAAHNILDSYAFQLRLSGGLPARLAYVTRYWVDYLYAKYLRAATKGEWGKAHLFAMESLAASGRSRRPVAITLPDGLKLEVDLFTCHLILKELYWDGAYDAPECDPREGQTVFDVGGQQGIYTVMAARRVGPRGKVVSVEPEPRNFGIIAKNVSLNGLTNVVAVQEALLDKAGEAELVLCGWNAGGHSLSPSATSGAAKVRIRTRTLDALAAELKAVPDVIKIDVEGSELAVLRGALGTIQARRPAVIMELDALDDAAVVKGLLAPFGYSVRVSGSMLFAHAAGA